jgi:hypothetical protein
VSDRPAPTPWRRDAEAQQLRWKTSTPSLPEEARADGTYFSKSFGRGRQVTWQETGPYPHCLPRDFAAHNLLPSIRHEALTRLDRFQIAWHGETPRSGLNGNEGPTTNLLSSQVQCINSLLCLENAPGVLLERLQTVVPGARKIVPIRHTNHARPEGLVAFEWIGRANYLGERVRGERTRGSFVTSADALIVVEREGGRRTGILIEWKFTESYHAPMKPISSAGTDRREIYRPHYDAAHSPFKADRPPIDAFFHEPHYQLLRQTLLAQGMRQAKEHGVDSMVVMVLMPAANHSLRTTVPEALRPYGETLDAVWEALVPGPDVRFVWQDTKAWLTATPELTERYSGLFAP